MWAQILTRYLRAYMTKYTHVNCRIGSPPRPPGSARITSNTGDAGDNVSLLLLPGASSGTGAGGDGMMAPMLQQLAILTPDVDAFADRVEKSVVGASVRIAVDDASAKSVTKVAIVTDPEVRSSSYAHTHILQLSFDSHVRSLCAL